MPIPRLVSIKKTAFPVLCCMTLPVMSWSVAAADPVALTIKHGFTGAAGDAANPATAPTLGKDGSLYGVAPQGGTSQLGAIYRIQPNGTTTTLYSFPADESAGDRPYGSLVRDAAGNFYGMANNGPGGGRGVIFRITPAGVLTVLHVLASTNAEGGATDNAVTLGTDGNLYGVTSNYGPHNGGTFFRLKTDGSGFTVLYDFPYDYGLATNPQASIVQGPDGAFYGLTSGYTNASGIQGYGAAYRMTIGGVMTVLYGFMDGAMEPPIGTPAVDAGGALYFFGGIRNSVMPGRVYQLDAGGTLTTLHLFSPTDGTPGPNATQLLLGKDGRLYGTTTLGGLNFPPDPSFGAYGTAFSLGLDGSFAVLHNFGAPNDGTYPTAGLVAARDGSLWGVTTQSDIAGTQGVAYRLTPPTVRLSVFPATVAAGSAAKLTWSSGNATGCAASGAWGPGSQSLSGSQSITEMVAGKYAFTLTCAGAGSKSRTVTLTVN